MNEPVDVIHEHEVRDQVEDKLPAQVPCRCYQRLHPIEIDKCVHKNIDLLCECFVDPLKFAGVVCVHETIFKALCSMLTRQIHTSLIERFAERLNNQAQRMRFELDLLLDVKDLFVENLAEFQG